MRLDQNVMPSALAVFMLMISPILVCCWMGRFAGFSPLTMRPEVRTRVSCSDWECSGTPLFFFQAWRIGRAGASCTLSVIPLGWFPD
jgi:hypothetical protein